MVYVYLQVKIHQMINIKRVFIISLFLSYFFMIETINAQKVNALDVNGKRDGNWKKYYNNGRLRYTGNFKNGKEVGIFMYFKMTNSKHPTSLKIFSKDSDVAKIEYYTPKGDIRSRGSVKGKDRIGRWTYFFSNGKLLSEEFYTEGKLDGMLKNYYPNGKITEETGYKNGLKNGISKKYSDEGILIEEVTFVNGKYDGLAKFFDLKGNLKETGNYQKGKRVGSWEFFVDGESISDKENRKKKTHAIPKK